MSEADRMINEQIAREIDKLNDFMTDEEDKPAIISRIADLKAMLDTPSPCMKEPTPPTFTEIAREFIATFRNR